MNVAFPGPWSREQASGALFSIQQLGLPPETQLRHVWLELPLEVRKDRIAARADPRDAWKLAHWDSYVDALKRPAAVQDGRVPVLDASRSEEHTSELQSLMRISYAVFCLKKKKKNTTENNNK